MIRLAVPSDRRLFASLWHSHLSEMREKGSDIVPSDRTMAFYLDLFDAYTYGNRDGIVALEYPIAVSMAGDCTPQYDTDLGKQAIGWGTFVVVTARGRDLATKLREFVMHNLQQLGFNTLIGAVDEDDEQATKSLLHVPGLVYHQRTYYVRLSTDAT